jgi:hypothetical protein
VVVGRFFDQSGNSQLFVGKPQNGQIVASVPTTANGTTLPPVQTVTVTPSVTTVDTALGAGTVTNNSGATIIVRFGFSRRG